MQKPKEKGVQTEQSGKMSHEAFREFVEKKTGSISGKVSVVAENILTGEAFAWNESAAFNPASTIKLPILCAAYHWAQKGQLDLNGHIALKASDKAGGFGILSELGEGLQLTLRDLMKLMIVISDNTATNMVIEAVGIGRIKTFLEEHGLGEIRAERKMFDYDAIKKGFNNVVTGRSLAKNLKGLARGTLLAPEYCKEALDILLRQQCNNKMPAKIIDCRDLLTRQGPINNPAASSGVCCLGKVSDSGFNTQDSAASRGVLNPSQTIKIAHKTGEMQGVEHDIGIVYTPRSEFLFVFLAEDVNNKAAIELVQDLTQDFVNYFDQL